MIRYLTEAEVRQLLTMKDAVALVEDALRARAEGRAVDVPRVRTHVPQGTLHTLQAASHELNRIGYKAHYTRASDTNAHVQLYDIAKVPLDATLAARHIGLVRTGAASGVATRYLAREDASIVAMIGSGKQAVGQLEAVCHVRKVKEVRVWSRNIGNARKFCEELASKLK